MPKRILSEISTKHTIYFSVGLKLFTRFTFYIAWNNPQTTSTTTFNSQAAQETKLIKTLFPSQLCFLERGCNLCLGSPLLLPSPGTAEFKQKGCIPQLTHLSYFWEEWVGSSFFNILLCGICISNNGCYCFCLLYNTTIPPSPNSCVNILKFVLVCSHISMQNTQKCKENWRYLSLEKGRSMQSHWCYSW